MFIEAQYRLLRRFAPRASVCCNGRAYDGQNKALVLLGPDLFERIKDKTVIDFGCGDGNDAIEFARHGATRVIGVDIREECLVRARRNAADRRVAHLCEFTSSTEARADVIVSIDAFEHFADPAGILNRMKTLLAPEGEILVSFGPTWFHPLGGHGFSVFPWAHLLFSERALIKWRSHFSHDGATRFAEVAGGLNQMTITRFERFVAQSAFRFTHLECVPIRVLKALHNTWTREFTTAVVRCRLVRDDPKAESA